MNSLILICLSLLMGLVSCVTHTRTGLPMQYADKAEIKGMPGVRAWGDRYSEVFQEDLINSIRQHLKTKPEGHNYRDDTIYILALSGGGSNGAFAAGLIRGWDDLGTRPTFKLVTGISTGSLIAPFAFLGGKYDKIISDVYTSMSTDDILKRRHIFTLLRGAISAADSSPLAGILAKYVDEEMLKAIAEQHSKGRRLYIGTTNLDAHEAVIWNLGAIASSGHPDALKLIHQVMLASASIPVAFPPQLIEVEAGGATYDEMHVDGGVTTEVFFYGFMLDIKAAHKTLGIKEGPQKRIYIVRSNQINPKYKIVQPKLMAIAGNALSKLTSSQGLGDLYRIYLITRRDGIDFNLASIPDEFVANPKEPFDSEEMNRLYDLAYKMAKSGYPWEKFPTGYHD
ncbi:MAG: patatin-like phospholipase family protein [Candidatus Neomarinimicrobiota bacterium]